MSVHSYMTRPFGRRLASPILLNSGRPPHFRSPFLAVEVRGEGAAAAQDAAESEPQPALPAERLFPVLRQSLLIRRNVAPLGTSACSLKAAAHTFSGRVVGPCQPTTRVG